MATVLNSRRSEPIHQREITASSGENDEIHDEKHGVVAPAVRSGFASEAGAPHENLLPDRTEHDEDQTDGSELSENAKHHPQPSSEFSPA